MGGPFSFPVGPGTYAGSRKLGLEGVLGTSFVVVPRSAFPGIFADLGKLCCKSKDEIDGTWHFSYLSCILNPDLQKKRREVGGPACVLCEYRCLSRPEGGVQSP